jgi:hypothetical protein
LKLCNCEDQSLAVIVIASDLRLETTLPAIVHSVTAQEPDEFLVVASGIHSANFPFLNVAPLTRTTIDALVKRDAGFVATKSRNILYLSDDHQLAPDFVKHFRERYQSGDWDVLVPSRFTVRGQTIYPLPVGRADQWCNWDFCGGHAGVFRRAILQKLPWTASPHHRNWDAIHSKMLVERGARLAYADTDLAIEDIEPGARPWE